MSKNKSENPHFSPTYHLSVSHVGMFLSAHACHHFKFSNEKYGSKSNLAQLILMKV